MLQALAAKRPPRSQSSVCEVPVAEENFQNMGCPSREVLHWPGAKSQWSQEIPRTSIPGGELEPFDKYYKIHASFFFSFFLFSFLFTIIVTGEPRQTDKSNYNAQGVDGEGTAVSMKMSDCSSRAGSTTSMGTGGKTFPGGMFPKLGCGGLIMCTGAYWWLGSGRLAITSWGGREG